MEGDSDAPRKSGADDTYEPAADTANAPSDSEELKSSPTPSMSGALQGEDAIDTEKKGDDAEEPATNGTVEVPVAAPSTIIQPADGDAEIQDSSAPGATSDAAAAGETNGTPSAIAKRPSHSKRKSTGGVPEHKTKKLNKKKSISKITHLDAQPGEYYFARLKSYPPWPAIICDEGMLPHSLLSTRPVTTKQVDGTYKEPYADDGKRVHERTFPIMFLHTNEFAWLPNTELTKLDAEECKDVSEKGKSKSLIQAYHVAAEGHDLEHFKSMLLDHQKAMQEDQERREAREAAKADKAERSEKKKRKSVAAEEDDEDEAMEDAEDEDKAEPKKSSKKRKKEVESDGEEEKPAKTPKTATKLKLTTPKAPGTNEKKAKESSKTSKTKSERKKSKAAATSDEEVADEEVKEAEKELDPAEAKAKKEKEVLFLRHKLQKGFLSRDQAPQESEMAIMSNFITKLENYGDLEVSIIRSTKINKVLKALIKLNTIPKDEEFNFKSRSVELLGRWNRALGADSAADEPAGTSGDKEEQPTTNGIHKDDKESTEEKKDTPTAAEDAVKGDKPLPDASAAAKEAVIDEMIDGDASSTAVAQKAGEAAEEDREDAAETC